MCSSPDGVFASHFYGSVPASFFGQGRPPFLARHPGARTGGALGDAAQEVSGWDNHERVSRIEELAQHPRVSFVLQDAVAALPFAP
jgi:hypothetical protein